MPTTATPTAARPLARMPRTFAGLCRMHPLRPVHDDDELEAATGIIDAMAGHKLTGDQDDYLDALATLVDRYETEHHAEDGSSLTPADRLRALMEANGLTTIDAGALLGADRSLVSHILAGRRSLTWDHARTLGERFALPPTAFMA
jgi:HTH-type transcriptional regulator/antitoxin HigA